MRKLKNESGRSMVEMLGVLAIIGVLSVTGIYGYKQAMTKMRANEILNYASMFYAQAVLGDAGKCAAGDTVTDASFGMKATGVIKGLTLKLADCPDEDKTTGEPTPGKIIITNCPEGLGDACNAASSAAGGDAFTLEGSDD